MSTIREVTADAISAYPSQAKPIVAALEQREQEMRDALIEAGTRMGARSDDLDQVMDQIGLGVPPRAESNGSESTQIASLEQRIERLESLARGAGLL